MSPNGKIQLEKQRKFMKNLMPFFKKKDTEDNISEKGELKTPEKVRQIKRIKMKVNLNRQNSMYLNDSATELNLGDGGSPTASIFGQGTSRLLRHN